MYLLHHISSYEESFLGKMLEKRIVETGCGSQKEYDILLECDSEEENLFLESLRISYSQFFRNPLTYAVLEQIILPKLIRKAGDGRPREIRIWSAACASG